MLMKPIAILGLMIGASSLAAQEVTYRKDIAPLWKAQCVTCHGEKSPERAEFLRDEKGYAAKSLGPRMDSYERILAFIGWPDTGALMRRLDDGTSPGAGGKPGNMYVNLGATEQARAANLKLLKAWVGEGGWNLNRFEKKGDTPGVSVEQLARLKLAY
jgi:hypothetical protein